MLIIHLNIHGLNVSLQTDDEKFYKLILEYYDPFVSQENDKSAIEILFSRRTSRNARYDYRNSKRYGENLYLGKSGFSWSNKFGFRCSIQLNSADHWIVEGHHDDLLLNDNPDDILKNMIRSMRWLIHFPVFEMLNRTRGLGLIHASAVANSETSLIFSGLNKVGKSSLARFYFEHKNYQYISDNFLLHDESLIYAFPEKVRLSDDAMNYYGLIHDESPKVYEKRQLNVPLESIKSNAKIDKIFYVVNGKKLQIKNLGSPDYNKTIDAAHRYLKEFSEYEFFSFLDLFSDIIGQRKRISIASHFDFFELTLPMNWQIESVVEEIQKCI